MVYGFKTVSGFELQVSNVLGFRDICRVPGATRPFKGCMPVRRLAAFKKRS